MRVLAVTAASLLMTGCASRTLGLVVEDDTPIVGPNGTTTEALGVETLGGIFTPLIPAGSAVPCSVSETFSTATDRQTQIFVTLFRGNDSAAARNRALGRFQVVDIPSAPRGAPRIQVTFAITKRTISLAARDLAGRRELRIVKLEGERR